jgi:hypothetical protein
MTASVKLASRLRDVVWSHRNFEATHALVQSLATYAPQGSMILIAGASGTGKSTLSRKLIGSLTGPPASWPKGSLPIISTSICNDVQGLFSSKNFVLRLLDAVQHPFYSESPGHSSASPSHDPELALERIRLRYSEPHLRLALESALAFRGTKFILLDEAQHLLKSGSERKAVDNLDSIKGLAERTGTTILLLGTFEIVPIWNRSAQLNRRLQDVVLHRYYSDRPKDLEEFARILEAFEELLPLHKELSLVKEAEYIYECTLGIIGELSRLFTGACARMSASQKTSIDLATLKLAAHCAAKLQTLRRETLGGESELRGELVTRESIQRPPHPRSRAVERPGRRRPMRDPVRPPQ